MPNALGVVGGGKPKLGPLAAPSHEKVVVAVLGFCCYKSPSGALWELFRALWELSDPFWGALETVWAVLGGSPGHFGRPLSALPGAL